MSQPFNPQYVNLTDIDPVKVICYLKNFGDEPEDQNAKLGLRIAAIFLLLVSSTLGTVTPLFLEKRELKERVPEWVYDLALQFGAGVILATAFVHLLPSAYEEIGSNSCVSQTGTWVDYPWVAGIILTTIMFMFLLHTGAQQYVNNKYGNPTTTARVAEAVAIIYDEPRVPETPSLTGQQYPTLSSANGRTSWEEVLEHVLSSPSVTSLQSLHLPPAATPLPPLRINSEQSQDSLTKDVEKQEERDAVAKTQFPQQLSTFSILEFGVLFHSAIIGLNLGTNSSSGLATLLVALIFHQTFEGLGVGARLADINFPKRWNWLKWLFCALYGSITSIAIAVGLGVRHTYDPESFTANIVSGVLDSASCGILIYTGLVELLAKDFIFNQEKKTNKKLVSIVVFVLSGVLLMALLAKWV